MIVLFALLFFFQPANITAQSNTNSDSQDAFSVKLNASATVQGSGAYYFGQSKFEGGFDVWANIRASGDVGKHVSYFADIGVALLYAKRAYLGTYQANVDKPDTVTVYSQPLGYFPFAYQSAWGGFIFPLTELNAGGPAGWPDTPSIGFNLLGEIAGTAFNDVLQWRFGRNEREAAGIVEGSSLALNKFAQPFVGYDLSLNPMKWLSLYTVTGGLEYYNSEGIQTSSSTFQNAFTLSMLTLHFRQHIQIDVGSSAIWPKRFELGYLFPLMIPLLYQNNIGDFDNLTLFGNLKLQYPDLGFVWFSLFIDEMNFEKDFFKLDREMYAYQAGIRWLTPFLAFGSITASYTKIEPYCYTHQKVKVPWYDEPMQQAYTNHGYGLGYYLPPNSDEIKIAFAAMTSPQTTVNLQFQMIRHGADYGEYSVDGSSYESELTGDDRSRNPRLRKDFLHDGAYQTQYIIKSSLKYTAKKIPLDFSFSGGMVFSLWTYDNAVIDTSQYPKRNYLVAEAGMKIFF